MRLSNATIHFTRQLAANGCSVHTQKAYARDLAAFAHWLGRDASLSAIKPDDLARHLIGDAVLCTPDGQPRKPITINRTKSARRDGRSLLASREKPALYRPLFDPAVVTPPSWRRTLYS